MSAIENAAVVRLDAAAGAPTLGVTLTTARPFPRVPHCGCDGPGDCCMRAFSIRFRRDMAQLVRWLRAELKRRGCPRIEYLAFIEWTSGQGEKSGGRRRMHAHLLVKGAELGACEVRGPAAVECACEVHSIERAMSAEWHAITGDAYIVEARPLRTPAGAIAYLTLHHHKTEQGPPVGWSGRRLRASKGYWSRPIAELREEARAAVRERRTRARIAAAIARDPVVHADGQELAELIDGMVRLELENGTELHRCAVTTEVDSHGEVRDRVRYSMGRFEPGRRRPSCETLPSGRQAGVPSPVRWARRPSGGPQRAREATGRLHGRPDWLPERVLTLLGPASAVGHDTL
jgi:hypothetical protein